MATIPQKMYALSVGRSPNTTSARLQGVPWFGTPRKRSYPLCSVLTTLTPTDIKNGAVERLFEVSRNTDFSGENMLSMCRKFLAGLNAEQRERFEACRNAFTVKLYEETVSSAIWQYIDFIQLNLVLRNDILRCVMLGEPIPQFDALEWALLAARSDQSTETHTEAA